MTSPRVWQRVSEDLKDLLQRMLMKEPGDRTSLEDALDHPWCVTGWGMGFGWSSGAASMFWESAHVPVSEGGSRDATAQRLPFNDFRTG